MTWPFCLPWIVRCWVQGHDPVLTRPPRGVGAWRWHCARCLLDLGPTRVRDRA